MITLPLLAYDLLELVRASNIIDDENIDKRQLYHWIHNQRALWITRKLNTILDLDDNLIQTITSDLVFEGNTVELKYIQTEGKLVIGREYTIKDFEKGVTDFISVGATVNRVDHTFVATAVNPIWGRFGKLEYSEIVPTDKHVLLRTKNKIPSTLELNYGNAVLEVTSPDLLTKEFSFVPFNQLRFSGNGLFNTKSLFVGIRDGYWYIKYGKDNLTPNTIKNIKIRAIFQTPTEIPDYDIDLTTYPINRQILDFMKEMIIKSNLTTILQTKSDPVNDSSGIVPQR
jgi:hypothetical protein